MRNFLLSSICLICISCASYTKDFEARDKTFERFTPDYLIDFEEKSFKISIEAFDNHFGGILVAKKMETNHFRFAFLNEFGGKMLDFEIIDKELKLNYAIEQLDRKIILNLLERDFAILFSEDNLIEKEFVQNQSLILQTDRFIGNKKLYYELNSDRKLSKITLAKSQERVVISLDNTEKPSPKMEFSHGKLPIKIYLHLLEND